MTDRATQLRASLDQTLQELARLESRPTEPDPSIPEATILFRKKFDLNKSRCRPDQDFLGYLYVAVRAKSGNWFTSAQVSDGQYGSWDQLLDFIEEDESESPQIWLATEWTTL